MIEQEMTRLNYIVLKHRFGREQLWGPWLYEARLEFSSSAASDPAVWKSTTRNKSIGELANELATFPGINYANMLAERESPSAFISLNYSESSNGIMTQEGIVTDDELGELAMRIVQYLQKQK